MLIFFSMIAGISQFGFWGIIVGPTITAFLLHCCDCMKITLSKTIKKHMNDIDPMAHNEIFKNDKSEL